MSVGPSKVFVSHAYDDKEFVSTFVESLLDVGAQLPHGCVIYTSRSGSGLQAGQYLNEGIRDFAMKSALTIAVITPTYLTREHCMAELYAAWGRGTLYPLLAPGVERSALPSPLQGIVIRDVSDYGALDELADKLRDLGFGFSFSSFNQGKEKWKKALEDGLMAAKPESVALPGSMKQADQGNEGSSASGLVNAAKGMSASDKDLEQVRELLGTWLTCEEFVDFLHAQPDYNRYPEEYLNQIRERKYRWGKDWWLIEDPVLSAAFQRLKEAVWNHVRESETLLFPSKIRPGTYEIPSEWAEEDRARWDDACERMVRVDEALEEALCELRRALWSRS